MDLHMNYARQRWRQPSYRMLFRDMIYAAFAD